MGNSESRQKTRKNPYSDIYPSYATNVAATLAVQGTTTAGDAAASGRLLIQAAKAEAEAAKLNAGALNEKAALGRALRSLGRAREFVSDQTRILGTAKTKHGEIAEVLDVSWTNATSIMEHKKPTATFDNIGRTAPVDFMIGNQEVQSKFYASANASLTGVIEHMNKYSHFSQNGVYFVPKDQYDVIKQVMDGKQRIMTVDGLLSQKSIDAIQRKLHEIQSRSGGKQLEELLKPSHHNYKDVQLNVVHRTLDGHEETLRAQTRARVEDLEAMKKNKERIQKDLEKEAARAKPATLQEAAGVAATGFAIGAGIAVGTKIYEKYRKGKTISEILREDWKELAKEGGKSGTLGAVSGVNIYYLTKSASLPAPFASAVVSSGQAVASLVQSYAAGEIDEGQLVSMGTLVCLEGGIVAAGTMIGQALIPIPVIGAMVGSVATKLFFDLAKDKLGSRAKKVAAEVERAAAAEFQKLDAYHQKLLKELRKSMDALGDLTKRAFDPKLNGCQLLEASIALATALKVPHSQILRTDRDLDRYLHG